MLDTATNLSRTGLRDWLIQRVSAVILGGYFLLILGYIVLNPHIEFYTWQALFAGRSMRIFSFLALLSMVLHAWVGIWTVLTDYVKLAYVRLLLQVIVILALLSYLLWGIEILWS